MVPFDLECVWLVHEVVFKEWNDREARGGGKKKELREARGGSIFFFFACGAHGGSMKK